MNIRRLFLAGSVLVVLAVINAQAQASRATQSSQPDGVVTRGVPRLAESKVDSPPAADRYEPVWLDDYATAVDTAMAEEKMLLICFDRPGSSTQRDKITSVAVDSDEVAAQLDDFVLLSANTDTEIRSKGEQRALLDFPAFAEMQKSPGLAMVDYRQTESPQYGHVVTVYPINGSRQVSPKAVSSMVQLPAGSLTQRSLVLAVMLHRERPQSVNAEWHPTLASEVESHSLHQARISLQGHHNWGSRFQRINSRLGNGMLAQEVCAESWPGQPLMDAAEECVNSWRQSSGHWRAVSGRQRLFAFDMKRGSNGTWYATGIFAR